MTLTGDKDANSYFIVISLACHLRLLGRRLAGLALRRVHAVRVADERTWRDREPVHRGEAHCEVDSAARVTLLVEAPAARLHEHPRLRSGVRQGLTW